jgi:protein-tyrosine sulfotransferase
MEKWNSAMELMFAQCRQVGPDRCMLVYYEQLVLHPKVWMERISGFLDLPWDDAVLHHEAMVGIPGGVALSKQVHIFLQNLEENFFINKFFY